VSAGAAADWPQWRGPESRWHRRKVQSSSRLAEGVGAGWQVDVGAGHSSPIAVGQHVFAFTRRDEDEVISCFNLSDGKEVWHQSYPAPYQVNPATAHGKGPKSDSGIRGRPRVHLRRRRHFFLLGCRHRSRRWQKDFSKQFKPSSPLSGTASSPVIVGDKSWFMWAAMGRARSWLSTHKRGEQKWSWEGDSPGDSSPVVGNFSDVNRSSRNRNPPASESTRNGARCLWKIGYQTENEQNTITPVLYEESVIFAGLNKGVGRYRIEKQGDEWRTVENWVIKEVAMYMSSPGHQRRSAVWLFTPAEGAALRARHHDRQDALGQRRRAWPTTPPWCAPASVIWALTTTGDLIAFRDSDKPFETARALQGLRHGDLGPAHHLLFADRDQRRIPADALEAGQHLESCAVSRATTAAMAHRVRPRRKISGISAVLLPFTVYRRRSIGRVFRAHVARTAAAGLTPAVNMDTGYVNLLDAATRAMVLDRTRETLSGGPFVAGAFVNDQPGARFNADAYRREIDLIQERGGVPVIFQSFGLTEGS